MDLRQLTSRWPRSHIRDSIDSSANVPYISHLPVFACATFHAALRHIRDIFNVCSHELDDQALAFTADPRRFLSAVLTCYPPCTQRLRYRSTPFNPNAIICRLVWISSRSGLPGTSVYGFHSTDACEGLSLVALSRFWPSHCTCPMS